MRAEAEESGAQPFLVSIGERAEALIALYEDRRISTQEALARFEALAQEYVEADARRQALGVDANSFAIYTALQPLAPGLTAAQATALDALFRQHPDYNWDIKQTNGRVRDRA